MMNATQAAPQENNNHHELIINGVTVRLSFAEKSNEDVPALVKDILKAAFRRCQVQ